VNSDTERELIQAARAGDGAAYDELVRLNAEQVYRFCRQITGDAGEAYDLAQQVFVKGFTSLRSFKFRSRFSSWLYRIAVNHWKNEVARHRMRSAPLDDDEPVVDGAVSVEQVMQRADAADVVRAVFAQLPEEYRAVLYLRYYEGKTLRETADILGISVSAAGVRVFRGLRKFRQLLAGKV